MSQYYNVVPWFNSEEWSLVYNKLYSHSSSFLNKQEALNLLLIWKARCPSLPSGIESTLSLLEVHVEDVKASDETLKQQVLRLAYSSAIMRFVNHMLDTEAAKGSSLYQAAKNLDVPDWIIDLRHDTAHSNSLPSIELLRDAAEICLRWLKNNYWEKHKEHIKDYLAGEKILENEDSKIAAIMNFCLSLSICAHTQCRIKSLLDIPDVGMRESIINDVREFFGESYDLSNLKTVSVLALINKLNSQSRRLLKGKDTSYLMNKALLGEDSLFLSLELVDLLGESDFHKKNSLGKHFMQCFEVLLTFLHSNDLILDFVLELITLSKSEELEDKKCKLAALWVSEILKALKRSQDFIDRMKKINSAEGFPKKKKELRTLFQHWFPNERRCNLLLDLQKGTPTELTDINYIQPIISSYNPYLICFIKDLLKLLKNGLPKETFEKICTLAGLISNPNQITTSVTKIYTVEDLDPTSNYVPMSLEDDSDSDCVEIREEPKINNDKSEDLPVGIWKLAPKQYNWSLCPLGKLPWQDTGDMIID